MQCLLIDFFPWYLLLSDWHKESSQEMLLCYPQLLQEQDHNRALNSSRNESVWQEDALLCLGRDKCLNLSPQQVILNLCQAATAEQ